MNVKYYIERYREYKKLIRKVDCNFMNIETIENSILSGVISAKGMNEAGVKMNRQMAQVMELTQGQNLEDAKTAFQSKMAEKGIER